MKTLTIKQYNAPSWFGAIWKVIRPMMSAEFAQKVVFLTRDSIREQFPDPNHLPKVMGGKLDLDEQLQAFITLREDFEKTHPPPPRAWKGHQAESIKDDDEDVNE